MRMRNLIVGASVAVGLVAPLAAAAPAGASPAVRDAEVTIVHGIPKTPVDVYVDGVKALTDFRFGTVTPELAFKPGTYHIAIRPWKASRRSAPILKANETLTAGENATIVADLTAAGTPTLSVYANPTRRPARHDARIIIRHDAYAPGVDIYDRSLKIVTDLTNPGQATLVLPAPLRAVIRVDVSGTKTTVIGPAHLRFARGTTTIIYAIGSATGGTLEAVVQVY